jgi:hypothetical protein
VRILVSLAPIALALIAAIAVAVLVLIEAVPLARLTIAIAHVLLIAILIAAWRPLVLLLFVVPFLIGHVSPPRVRDMADAGDRPGDCGPSARGKERKRRTSPPQSSSLRHHLKRVRSWFCNGIGGRRRWQAEVVHPRRWGAHCQESRRRTDSSE